MSYEIKYRNAIIIFSNENEYRQHEEEFTNTRKAMNDFLENLLTRLENKIFNEDTAIFFRVAPSNELTVYLGLTHDHNPYLFLYNVKEHIISREIPYEYFKKIGIAPYIYVFEDALKDNNLPNHQAFLTKDIKDQLELLSTEYDNELKQ